MGLVEGRERTGTSGSLRSGCGGGCFDLGRRRQRVDKYVPFALLRRRRRRGRRRRATSCCGICIRVLHLEPEQGPATRQGKRPHRREGARPLGSHRGTPPRLLLPPLLLPLLVLRRLILVSSTLRTFEVFDSLQLLPTALVTRGARRCESCPTELTRLHLEIVTAPFV